MINNFYRLRIDDMKCSLDFMSKLETSSFNLILSDFINLSQIFFHSDKCTPKDLLRFEEACRRYQHRFTLNDFINKSADGKDASQNTMDTTTVSSIQPKSPS